MAEKAMSAVPRPVREQFDKGMVAFQRGNLDYALSLFNQALDLEPGFFECRQALRAAQYKKQEIGGGGGFFKRMIGTASSSPLVAKGQLALRRNPIEALSIAEQILNSDPASTSAHRMIAEAALGAEMPKTAVLSLEILFRNNPKDRKAGMDLASALAKAGQTDYAERVLGDLLKAYPHDPEVSQVLKNVTAQGTLSDAGYQKVADEEGTYRELLKDKAEAEVLEQQNRSVKTGETVQNLITDHEERLAKEPHNLKIMRTLAELHAQGKHYVKSLEYYAMLKESEMANDPSLDRAIAETKVRQFSQRIDQLQTDSLTYQEDLALLQAEKLAFQLADARARSEKHPSDLLVRFELGVLYYESGQVSEAIQEFQKAQNNPNRRIQSLHYLGCCFAHRGMNDLALRTLQTALQEKPVMDQQKKDLLYAIGNVLETMGRPAEAIEEYKKIYEVDIGFQDVAAKIDAFYSSGK